MKSILISFVLGLLLFTAACKKEAVIQKKDYPFVVTDSVTDISSNGATFNAKVLDKGKEEIVDFGFKWHYIYYNPPYGRVEVFCDSSIYNTATLDDFNLQWNGGLRFNATYTVTAYIKTENYCVLGNKVVFVAKNLMTPVIDDFFPKEGFDGTIVKLTGSNFSPVYSKVFLNDKKAQILRVYKDSIIFKIPQSDFVGDAEISVSVLSKNVIADKKIRIIGPEIETVFPLSGYSGDLVTIKGKHLTNNGSSVELYFDEFRAEIVDTSETVIKVRIPALENSLLDDKQVIINLMNGKKPVNYSETFFVKHSWDKKKSPPYLPSSYLGGAYQGFSFQNKGYIFYPDESELYRYNSDNNQWDIASTSYHGGKYTRSLYIVIGDILYKIGGQDCFDNKTRDVWNYDFSNDKWTKQNDIPFDFTAANFFVIDDIAYVFTKERQMWKCDVVNQQYSRLNDIPFNWNSHHFSTPFTINNKGYVVLFVDTWQYDEQNDTWNKKADNPFYNVGYPRLTYGFGFNNTGYVLNGGKDLYKYNYNKDDWEFISYYPEDRDSYKTSFVIGNRVYLAALWNFYPGNAPFLFSYFEGD